MLRLSPTEAHWLFFKTNSLYRIRLYESNLAPPSVPLDLWAVHNDYGNGHINHIIAAAFILFKSLHKKRWRSCILMFLLMTSYHGVIKRENIHRTSEKSCFYAAMEHDNEMSEIFSKPVLATLSDEHIFAVITGQLELLFLSIIHKMLDNVFCEVQAQLLERFGSATRLKQLKWWNVSSVWWGNRW